MAHNPFWAHTDKKLIKNLVEIDKNNPKTLENYFKTYKTQKIDIDTTKTNLGFNWEIWSRRIGGGYIGISATFIYHNNTIVSYSITPELPEEKRLIKKYKKWYNHFFEFESNQILPYNFNRFHITAPLKEYNKSSEKLSSITQEIKEYMTPYSGTGYGYYTGGYSNNILLPNRKEFLKIRDSLTNEQVILIMYSINPASRLTAIEHYLKNRGKFTESKELEKWIERNFKETPIIETQIGCTRSEFLSTKGLVEMYSRKETEK